MRETFIRACMSRGAPEGACECALGEVRRRYTLEEYTALEARVARGEPALRELEAVMADCRGSN